MAGLIAPAYQIPQLMYASTCIGFKTLPEVVIVGSKVAMDGVRNCILLSSRRSSFAVPLWCQKKKCRIWNHASISEVDGMG